MRWTETLRIALEAIRTHKMRSALTMLGIFIGIAAVTLLAGTVAKCALEKSNMSSIASAFASRPVSACRSKMVSMKRRMLLWLWVSREL